MADKTKVFPVEAAEGKKLKKKEEIHNKSTRVTDEEKVKVDKFVELESSTHFNETMKRLTDHYFATSLESAKTFGGQIQRANNLIFRMHDIFTSVITTSQERLEQNPFEYDKRKLQGTIDVLSAKLTSEEEITKSQGKQILELEKNEARLEKLIRTQKTSIKKLNTTIEALHSDKAQLEAGKQELHLKVEAATKENQESLQKIADLQNQLHTAQQELQKIGELEREKATLEEQLSIAVETHKNEIIQISKQKDLEKQDEIAELQQKMLTKHQEELSQEVEKREEVKNTVLELNRIIQQQTEDAAEAKNNHEKEIEELNKKAIGDKNGYEAEIAKLKEEITSLKQQNVH